LFLNTQITKELKVTTILDKLLEYMSIKCPQMITQGKETLFSNWQKESWQTFEETSGYVRRNRSTSGPTP
jgi:hypothetical protein